MVEPVLARKIEKEKKTGSVMATAGPKLYQQIVEFCPDALLIIDPEGKVIEANPSSCSMLGYSREELLQNSIKDLMTSEGQIAFSLWQAEQFPGKTENYLFEHEICQKSGNFLTVQTNITQMPEGNLLLVLRNLTVPKQGLTSLRKKAELYRIFAMDIPDVIIELFDRDKRFILAEGSALERLHLTRESFEGKTLWEVLPPDEVEQVIELYDAALAGEHRLLELEFRGFYYRVHTVPVQNNQGEIIAGIILAHDITKSKQAELALQASEARYRQLFLSAKRQVLELDLLHQLRSNISNQVELPALFQTVVEILYQDFGYKQVSLYLRDNNLLVLQHQCGYEEDEILKQVSIRHGINGYALKTAKPLVIEANHPEVVVLDSKEAIVSKICVPLLDQGEVVGTLNVESSGDQQLTSEDLPALKSLSDYVSLAITQSRLYQEVRTSEERLRTVVSNAPVMLYTINREGEFIMGEGRGVELLGLQSGQLTGLSAFEVFQDSPQIISNFQKALAGETFLSTVEYRGLFFESWYSPVHNDQGEVAYIIGVSTDITEYKNAEKEIEARAHQQAVIAELGQKALILTNFENLLDEAVMAVAKVLKLEFASVMEMLPDNSGLLLKAGVGWSETEIGNTVLPSGAESFSGYAYSLRESLAVGNWLLSNMGFKPIKLITKHKVASSLSVIINTGNQQPYGVLVAHSTNSRRYSQNDLNFLQAVANVLAAAIERKRIEEAIQAQRDFAVQVMTTMGQALAVLDSSMGFDYINPAFTQLVGYTKKELGSKTPLDLVSSDYYATFCQFLRPQVKETGGSYEVELVRNDGQTRYVRVNAVPIMREGQPTGTIVVFSDLTERKRIESEIMKALEKEQELGELKSRFISITSHEFRTPLTTIQTNAELLKYYSAKFSLEKREALLDRIVNAVRYMTGMLEDILVIGQAQANKLSYKPEFLSLTKFCKELLQDLRPSLVLAGDKHSISFILEGEEPANGSYLDRNLTRHIVSNLLTNAIKYSPKGGEILFRLIFTLETAIIEIKDQGIGIVKEDLERLFQTFHRGKNIGTISGSGLGLSIVNHCVELQGGTIVVDSELNKGSIFRVSLPLKSDLVQREA